MKTFMKTLKPAPSAVSEFGREKSIALLKKMMEIRAFELKAEELFGLGKVHGTMHLSIGQEGSAVGANAALKPTDYLLNSHRGHGHCLAWGSELGGMMAEFMGKDTGYCRGRGGSMHIANVDANNLGANGIVGGSMPISVGVGLSIKQRKTDQVVMVVNGDGSINTGAASESFNMAAIWKLPIIFLCENNQYAMSMPVQRGFAIKDLSQRAEGFGIPGATIDGNNLMQVYNAVQAAAEHARNGLGPVFIESITYRWRGHSKSDKQAYRTRDEVKLWMGKDPIPVFAKELGLGKTEIEELTAQAQVAVDEAVAFAEASPEPLVENIMDGVYA
jgi:TPP-dependent pyruvate/acetoin dehydrogenase alpha subunit